MTTAKQRLRAKVRHDAHVHSILWETIHLYKRGIYGGVAHIRAIEQLLANGEIDLEEAKGFLDAGLQSGLVTVADVQSTMPAETTFLTDLPCE